MLKKTVKYEDYNGVQVEEDLYFHLSPSELMKLEVDTEEGLADYMQKIAADDDRKALYEQINNFILQSYGVKSEDGRRFIKTDQMREDFQSSKAYETLLLALITDAEFAADFFNGIMSAELMAEMQKLVEASESESQPEIAETAPPYT